MCRWGQNQTPPNSKKSVYMFFIIASSNPGKRSLIWSYRMDKNRCFPSILTLISPDSRSTLKWWERADFCISILQQAQVVSQFCARCFIISSRIGSPKALSIVDKFSWSTVGWNNSLNVFSSWTYFFGKVTIELYHTVWYI